MSTRKSIEALYGKYGYQFSEGPSKDMATKAPENQFAQMMDRIKTAIRSQQMVIEVISQSYIPDHVEAARRECVREFLENVLLPRVFSGQPLTALELQMLAEEHKESFRKQHPDDFIGDYEIIPAVEMELLQLWRKLGGSPNPAWLKDLVKRAALEMKTLLDENPEQLYTV